MWVRGLLAFVLVLAAATFWACGPAVSQQEVAQRMFGWERMCESYQAGSDFSLEKSLSCNIGGRSPLPPECVPEGTDDLSRCQAWVSQLGSANQQGGATVQSTAVLQNIQNQQQMLQAQH